MNKVFYCSSSLIVLTALTCFSAAQALSSMHHKRHKAPAPAQSLRSSLSRSHSARHHLVSKGHTSHTNKHLVAKPRYAYPMGIFLMEPPTFDASPLPESLSLQIKKSFYSGYAEDFPTRSLVRTGIASYYPMRGGIFWRREPIKYLIMHSTEPGISIGAKRVIDGWSHGGRRHAGAHYVIERDGTIYQAVDPDLATVHINIFKTLPGINNDNSIGIEMCHQGSQDYPPALMESASRLAIYLQNHYHIPDTNVITHRYAQQGDHTDPVNFNWDNFIAQKDILQKQNLTERLALLQNQFFNWQPILEQPVTIISEKKMPLPDKKPTTAINKDTSIKPAVSRIIETAPKLDSKSDNKPSNKNDYQVISPFEAKFGPISPAEPSTSVAPPKPNTETAIITAPAPSNNSGTRRLLPASPTNRLMPMTIIINTQSNNNPEKPPVKESSTDLNAQNNSHLLPANSNAGTKTRLLPLRGPIEMDPDEAASLINQ